MGPRPDVRLGGAPMSPVSCGTCGAHIQARKSSWEQTTIQWSAEAVAACVERRGAAARTGPNGATFLGCAALGRSLREAAVTGDLPVLDVDPTREREDRS